MANQRRRKTKKAQREAMFVRVRVPNSDTSEFFNATHCLGKEMPYKKPQATCAMRVEDDMVSFSLLHLTKKTVANVIASPLEIPRGPLARLRRKSQKAKITADTPNKLMVELGNDFHELEIKRSSSGVTRLEMAASDDGIPGDDVNFELPPGAIRVSIYMWSPVAQRILAVGFIGHIGRPNTSETINRVVSMILNSIVKLNEFYVLSELEQIEVPAPPAAWAYKGPVRNAEDQVVFELPVWLFQEAPDMAIFSSGTVIIDVDLDNASAASGKLLYTLTPVEKEKEAHESVLFHEVFKDYEKMLTHAVNDQLALSLGEELQNIAVDIVLGEVGSNVIDRLREAGDSFSAGFDLTPTRKRLHSE